MLGYHLLALLNFIYIRTYTYIYTILILYKSTRDVNMTAQLLCVSFIDVLIKKRDRKEGREKRKMTTIYFKWQILIDQLFSPLFPVSWMSDDLRLVVLNILSITIHLCKLLSHVLIIHPFSVNCRLFLINEAGGGQCHMAHAHTHTHPPTIHSHLEEI